ncbi:MAG: substrate-binding domain-containing protein [Solirubrobacteraceae bacterium]
MRRFIATTMALLGATAALAACGSDDDGGGGNQSAGGGGNGCTGQDGEFLIGMSQANNAEPYREVMNDDIRTAAEKVPQFEVEIADAAQDNAKQVSDVENFLTQQIDLLIISPNEATPLTSVVKKVYDQDIPVLVLDRKVDGDAYTTFIGANNQEIGLQAGEFIAKELIPDGGNVVEIKGLPGATPAQERSAGFAEGIEGASGIKVVATGVGDWLREKGQAQFEAILQAQPKIDVVYSHNDPMAEGAYLAAKSAGREAEMEFVGIDALPIPSGGIKAVEEGRLSATFTYPTGGTEAVAMAKKILVDCQETPKEVTLPTQRITEANAADVYAKLTNR